MGNLLEPMSHIDKNCTTDYEMDGPRLGLCVLEMGINAIVLGSSVLFGRLMCSISSFSTTMKSLFLNMLVAAFGIASTRLFILIPQYITINQLYDAKFIAPVQVFHDICINVNTLITMAITLECLIYSFRPNPRKSTTIFLCSINTFWPWFTTTLLYWLEQKGFIETVPLFIVLEIFNLMSWMIFLRLYFYNRKRYKSANAGSLEEKYEITVKIRVLRTLLFLAALTTLRNFLTMTLLIFIISYVQPQCLYYIHLYCNHTYDTSVALYSLLFIVPLIVSHNEFKAQFRRFVFGARKPPTTLPTSIAVVSGRHEHLKNALGETLIVPNTAGAYYRQLAESWNQGPQPIVAQPPKRVAEQQNGRNKNGRMAMVATLKVNEFLGGRKYRNNSLESNNNNNNQLTGGHHIHLPDRRFSQMVAVEISSNLSSPKTMDDGTHMLSNMHQSMNLAAK